ncbi:MAG TPA: anthranilate phosphoribosyltransferase [Planctomycetaceae bacterium]|nr:anthranilate phosphoribosyltransferase [Planctomycetaceae bacterium]
MAYDHNQTIQQLCQGDELSAKQMQAAISWFLSGQASESAIKEFLVALAEKGETATELAGAASAMRESMQRVQATRRPIVDTCGTGGDGAKTFNISTASALAIAACGVPVAKHGNRKITSSTGSADVLAELGINLEASPDVASQCLADVGICFCFAPLFHPAMRFVGPVRRQIDRPTVFNRLGPLSNPALAECQVLGVGVASLVKPMAEALQKLGTLRSVVVRGQDGVDEVSLSAPTEVLEVTQSGITQHLWTPEYFGVERASRDTLFADDPASSAACIRDVFSGAKGPCRDVVVINAAAGLWLVDAESNQLSLRECAMQVEHAIDSGKAREKVEQLAAATGPRS